MKTIKIPDYCNPYEVIVNGVKHIYSAGATVEVADEIADIIEASEAARLPEAPAPNPGANMVLNELAENGQVGYSDIDEIMSGELTDGVYEGLGVALEVGKTYTLHLDSGSYTAMAKKVDIDGAVVVYFGNGAILDGVGEDTGETYGVMSIDSPGVTIVVDANGGTNFSLDGEIAIPIDSKYIPKWSCERREEGFFINGELATYDKLVEIINSGIPLYITAMPTLPATCFIPVSLMEAAGAVYFAYADPLVGDVMKFTFVSTSA